MDPVDLRRLSALGGLAAVLAVSVAVSLSRPFRELAGPGRRRVRAVGLAGWLVQAAHFGEELSTGFWRAFPAVVGAPPWTPGAFALFNLAWLGVWALALLSAPRGARWAEWPLWFLALALLLNGVAHPALALLAGGYFPGLWTAVPAGLAGAWLLRELIRVTGTGEP